MNGKIALLVLKSFFEQGKEVDKHLRNLYNNPNIDTLMVPIEEVWFNDGHGKSVIKDTIRNRDTYIMTDIGNYSMEYEMHGFINHTSPNDLALQLLGVIDACKCHTKNLSIIMPLLYAGREHRRNGRNPLSCAQYLGMLDEMNRVSRFITFDAHDPGVQQAMRNTEFENFYATNIILEQFINNTPIEKLKNMLFIAPDAGAMGRMNFYLNSFNNELIYKDAGFFSKRRDYNVVIDGKNPIIEHTYSGSENIAGKTALVVDDMIASGGSAFDVIDELKKRGVENVYIVATFSLFTKGIEKFKRYYEDGKLDGVYTTNLSYIPEKYRNEEWLHVCDCTEFLAKIIYDYNKGYSISPLLKDTGYPGKVLAKKFNQ